MEFDLKSELRSYGAPDNDIRLLRGPEHHLIDYLDLMPNNRTSELGDDHVWLDAVVETQRQPLLYVVKSATLAQDIATRNDQIRKMRRDLACRGNGAYFAIIEPGTISIYPVGLSHDLPKPYTPSRHDNARLFIQDLAHGYEPSELTHYNTRERAVHELLYDLLNKVIDDLANLPPFSANRDDGVDGKDEVLSLVGRALFTRFLIDRGIMTAETFPTFGDPFEQCFNTATQATKTCNWLDEKFNGELLPLADKKYESYFQKLEQNYPDALKTLSNILYRAAGGQLSFELFWNDINFAHVPVGLLSEVYERFAHRHFGEHADRESVHYTPRMVAEYMVNQAFPGITSSPPDLARVLDPSAGAGVFLVLCLRRLVAERWKIKGSQPQTKDIRQILNEQIRGFDINGHALKLAALSLYLTALELDPDPFPPEKLVFAPLLGNVLFNARLPGEEFPHEHPVLGSLGPAIDERHNKQYDLIIGNPPWTPWKGEDSSKLNKHVGQIIRGIALRRDPIRLKDVAETYKNTNKVSDLPFMWRAMEWAKPDGVIALAMSARILFSRNDAVASNREALFKALRITGILNGTALRRTKVWPTIKAPFCLMFAINRMPDDKEVFQFISPEIDFGCNENGRMRIDYASAHPIQFSVLRNRPTILKTLFRGTVLDADIMMRIESNNKIVPIIEYLAEMGLQKHHGEGFQTTRGGKIRAQGFHGKPYLTANNAPVYFVNPNKIQDIFEQEHLYRKPKTEIFKGPLLILRSSLQSDRNKGCGIFSYEDILFNESFYGCSGHGHAQGNDLVRYLYVLSYSQLFQYVVLVTSAKFGFEREVIYKEDFDQFPLVPLENLSAVQVEDMRQLSKEIMEGERPWTKVDAWVAGIYKLSASDQQVIADTIEVAMPFTSSITRSQEKPTKTEVAAFSSTLNGLLKPFFEITGEHIEVVPRDDDSHSWIFLDVFTSAESSRDRGDTGFTEILKVLANNEGASLIKAKIRDGHLLLGILAQYRYWTPSRCRMLSMSILRDSEDFFPVVSK